MSAARSVAFAAALILVACASLPHRREIMVWPPEPAHLVRVAIHQDALAQLESLAMVTRQTRTEQAACVTEFGALPVARNGWIIAIMAIGPSPSVDHTDSLFVYGRGPLCPKGIPVVHSHVVRNEFWGRPSDFDTSRFRWLRDSDYAAPFAVLVSVGSHAPSRITIYGLRP